MSGDKTLAQMEPETHEISSAEQPSFRVEPSLNEALLDPARRPTPPRWQERRRLPEPVYPQRPNARQREMPFKEYNRLNRSRNVHCWLLPYMRARVRVKEFRPILSYLFTEWKCNLDCHYCWAFDNRIQGMTEDVAMCSIDWLHSVGCRVAAIMGGEPLLRPQFIHKLVYYGVKRGFFMYLPTNGRLMRPEVIDRLGDAGVAVWNLAVDAVEEKPGLPKALAPIGPYFEHLVRMQRHYGFMAFFNINICRNNIEDVKQLTEIARDHGIATDYHINESPMLSQEHFRHIEENPTFLRPEDHPRVDDLLDYLSDKNRAGYKMVNSVRHFQDMKKFMRGLVEPWECRAGQNTSLIRIDGTLAPCFSMYSATHDWGTIENPRFDPVQLSQMKRSCNAHCLSTCQHTVGYAFSARRVLKWLGRQALRGFRGVSGSF